MFAAIVKMLIFRLFSLYFGAIRLSIFSVVDKLGNAKGLLMRVLTGKLV